MLELKTISQVQNKVVELQNVILSAQNKALVAQSQHSELMQHAAKLEKEIKHIKAWEEEKIRYSLKSVQPGVFVYALTKNSKRSYKPVSKNIIIWGK